MDQVVADDAVTTLKQRTRPALDGIAKSSRRRAVAAAFRGDRRHRCASIIRRQIYRHVARGAYAAAGRRADAQKLIDRVVMNGGGNSFVALARAYAALGDVDNAVVWLQKAIPRREAALRSIPGSPEFDNIRDDPRFTAVVATIGIPFKK